MKLEYSLLVVYYYIRMKSNRISIFHSLFLSIPAKKEQFEYRPISFFLNESFFMLFRTVQFFSLWDRFTTTRGNENNYRMDCYLCLDRG